MSIKLNYLEKQDILARTKQLPMETWLELCETLQQEYHWADVKIGFEKIHEHLKAYFSGKDLEVIPSDEVDNKCFKLKTKQYIDFYDVIYYGFKELKKAANKVGYEIPDSPGKYLLECIAGDSYAAFDRCLSYHEYRPKQLRKLASDSLSYPNKSGNKPKHFNSDYEKQVLAIYNRRKHLNQLEWFALDTLKRSKDEDVKISLTRFGNTCSRLLQLINSEVLHPDKKPTNITWNRGLRTPELL